MALGGGSFTTQNKELPGAYINFVSMASASTTLYANRRDLVDALLEAEKQYTKKEVDELINKFMKGTVK